jgi:hypothetical protein
MGRERFFISRFSGAHYSVEGKVLSGPAKAPLPYFRARLAEGSWGSARDTLFVELGSLNEVEIGDSLLPRRIREDREGLKNGQASADKGREQGGCRC